jgi:hypothetical protein
LVVEVGAFVTGLLGALDPPHRVQFGAAALLGLKAALALTVLAFFIFVAVVANYGD